MIILRRVGGADEMWSSGGANTGLPRPWDWVAHVNRYGTEHQVINCLLVNAQWHFTRTGTYYMLSAGANAGCSGSRSVGVVRW